MRTKIVYLFIFSAGVLLLVTGLAKIISGFGDAKVLRVHDPILVLPFRYVFWIVGVAELIVSLACLLGRQVRLQVGLITLMASCFVAYRAGLTWIGFQSPCSCLGTLTGSLHISPHTADNLMKAVLTYLLIGSYTFLFLNWRQSRSVSEEIQTVANGL